MTISKNYMRKLLIHQVKRYRDKRYRAKQRYRADFFIFFWLDNVLSGVLIYIAV